MFDKLPSSRLIRFALLPFSWLYGLLVSLRNLGYTSGLFKTVKLERPVIAIGNITVGGTGKTPLTIALARLLIARDLKVGIVSRGYKRQSREPVVVSDGQGRLNPPEISGDEPYLMAQKVPRAVIIVDTDRVRAARTACTTFGCAVILADDAFQHRRLGRELDIVLWDHYLNPRKQHLLPAGRLREPYRGLKRADWLLFTKTEHLSQSRARFFSRYNQTLAITTAALRIEYLTQAATGQRVPPNLLSHQSVLSFCGLGNQRQFFDLVAKLNPKLQIEVEFPDHYRYSSNDIEELQAKAHEHGCTYLVTTEKDFANLPPAALNLEQLLVVAVELELDPLLEKHILKICLPE